jgi:hypothetical protein
MKLFAHLTEAQQSEAISICMTTVLSSLINGTLPKENDEDNILALLEKVNEELLNAKASNLSEQETMQALMENEKIALEVEQLSYSMAVETFYHEENENVIFLDMLESNAISTNNLLN